MAYNEYTYHMKPVIIPGILYLILFPLCVITMYIVLNILIHPLEAFIYYILSGIYGITAIAIVAIWAVAGSRRLVFDQHSIILSDMFSKRVFNPSNIQRVTFYWSKKKEIVKIRTRGHVVFFSDLYVPYNQLLADMENYIYTFNIRTNLRAHADRSPQRYDGFRERDGHYRGHAR